MHELFIFYTNIETINLFQRLYFFFLFLHKIEEQWKIVRSLSKEYYPICNIWLGPAHAVVSIFHPDDIEVRPKYNISAYDFFFL